MNKFLYMPLVLGLVFGCAGYAAGNDDNENQEDPRPLLRQQITNKEEEMKALDDRLSEIGRQHPELSDSIQNLKYSKRNIADWKHVELPRFEARRQRDGRLSQSAKEQYEAYLEEIRKGEEKINPITESLQEQDLGEVINIVDEYARINIAKFDLANRLDAEEHARR